MANDPDTRRHDPQTMCVSVWIDRILAARLDVVAAALIAKRVIPLKHARAQVLRLAIETGVDLLEEAAGVRVAVPSKAKRRRK